MYTIYIDPGLGGTGWAYFSSHSCCSETPELPNAYGVLRGHAKETWIQQSNTIRHAFSFLLEKYTARQCVIEFPCLWSGSGLSQASASRGDLFKLAYLCGSLAAMCGIRGVRVELPSPQDWKGQLPKDVVIKRILRFFPEGTIIKDHEADAIGMGIAAQGALCQK